MSNTSIFDKNLNPVLEVADNNDLDTLVDYLKKKFSENLTIHDSYKTHSPNHTEYADIIGSSRFRGVSTTYSVSHSQITAYLRHQARYAGIAGLSHIFHNNAA